jgi:hypothetical protein
MRMSEKIDLLIGALSKAQLQFSEPKKTKQAYNYKYSPMDEVRAATIQALSDNDLYIYQNPISRISPEGM